MILHDLYGKTAINSQASLLQSWRQLFLCFPFGSTIEVDESMDVFRMSWTVTHQAPFKREGLNVHYPYFSSILPIHRSEFRVTFWSRVTIRSISSSVKSATSLRLRSFKMIGTQEQTRVLLISLEWLQGDLA